MNSVEDELCIKILAHDTIYNFVDEKFFIWKIFRTRYDVLSFSKFRI